MRAGLRNFARTDSREARPGHLLLAVALVAVIVIFSTPAPAATQEGAGLTSAPELSVAEAAALCEAAAVHHERANALPRALLAAVAMAESGRYIPKKEKSRPWPWTINAEGKAYYFNSKAEAIAKTQQLLDSGMRSIDVGCMQVNLRYHPDAFASLEDAFDPMMNVAYGAEFLMELRERTGSWQQAVANYHSQTGWRGGRYFARVIRIWENERNRVANFAYTPLPERRDDRVDVSGILKPAILRGEAAGHSGVTAASYRPAPKVLDTAPVGSVRASAAVGLRLSIAEEDVGPAAKSVSREEPRVLDPHPALNGPTQMAEAAIPGA
jgi:hypothetical protein